MMTPATIVVAVILGFSVAGSSAASRTAAESMAAMTAGCGESKACFVARAGCFEYSNCTAAVTVVENAGVYRFEMRSLRGRYISVALSPDEKMGNDAVVECVYDNVTTLAVDAFVSWNYGHSNSRIDQPLAELGVTFEAGSYEDGSVACTFTRLATTTINGTEFTLGTTPYHLLLAAGYKLKEFGIARHDVLDAASTHAQLLHEPGMFDGKGAGATVHACVWLIVVALGARLASTHH